MYKLKSIKWYEEFNEVKKLILCNLNELQKGEKAI